MDSLSEEEPSNRIGYDDLNESLSSKAIVHSTLSSLGLTLRQILSEKPNLAFRVISLDLGLPPMDAGDTSREGLKEGSIDGFQADQVFTERIAAFWSSSVIRKTFVERRTW